MIDRAKQIVLDELNRPEYAGLLPYIDSDQVLVLDACQYAGVTLVNKGIRPDGTQLGQMCLAWVNPNRSVNQLFSPVLPISVLEKAVVGAGAQGNGLSPMGAFKVYEHPTLVMQLSLGNGGLIITPVGAAQPPPDSNNGNPPQGVS